MKHHVMEARDGMDAQRFASALGIRVVAGTLVGRSAVRYFARSQKYQQTVECKSSDKIRINIIF